MTRYRLPVKPEAIINLTKLTLIRKAKKLSKRQLAQLIHLHPETYRLYENGTNHITTYALRELYSKLNLDPLTLTELLHLPFPNQELLNHFRLACKLNNSSISQALSDMITIYTQQVLKHHQTPENKLQNLANSLPDLIPFKQAASLLNIKPTYLRTKILRKTAPPHIKINNRIFFKKSVILNAIKLRKTLNLYK